MACFTVSLAAALGVSVARHIVKHRENNKEVPHVDASEAKFGHMVKWSKKLAYLELALFAGAFVLAGEHILHGEVTFYPPFLTAVGEGPEATMEMLKEMGTIGVTMMLLVILAWGIGTFIVEYFKYKKASKAIEEVK